MTQQDEFKDRVKAAIGRCNDEAHEKGQNAVTIISYDWLAPDMLEMKTNREPSLEILNAINELPFVISSGTVCMRSQSYTAGHPNWDITLVVSSRYSGVGGLLSKIAKRATSGELTPYSVMKIAAIACVATYLLYSACVMIYEIYAY